MGLDNCFQWFKDTKMKANHNKQEQGFGTKSTVSNGSKIGKLAHIRITLEKIM